MRVMMPDLPPFRALPFGEGDLADVTPLFYRRDRLPQEEVDGVVLWSLPQPQRKELLNRAGLKWALTLTAGIDHVVGDLPDGVQLYNASALHDEAVAQHAAALLLAAGRGLGVFRDRQRHHEWKRETSLHTMQGRTVVVWGYGHIGKLLEKLLTPFGARVVGLTSRQTPQQVDQALGEADDLVLLLPRTPQTRHILDARRLALLKPGCWVANLGRGELIEPSALVAALTQHRIGGALLDVTDPEPLPEESPLWRFTNVIITPHVASTTDDLTERGADYTRRVLEAMLSGGEVPGRVERSRGY